MRNLEASFFTDVLL